MEDLVARRKVLKANLTRLKKKVIEEAPTEWDIDTICLHEEHIDELRKEFKNLYDEIFLTVRKHRKNLINGIMMKLMIVVMK
ncbi:unnamed protein product [Allacma fusca]|uniref:Uncharacterized protein n=1 Tax=Allacma fusca TaxID=39272 RepID=A0A8J2PG65_9HEXA|nr:unnamed protein product [Allacma fusca]